MILGYEEPVQMPTMDIYSTDLMKMYITGVKEQYDRGLKEYDDFMKQYQDFYSAMPGANEFWYNNTIGAAQKMIDDAQSQGIDLFKSPEGRAQIRKMMNSVPLGQLQQVRKMSDVYDQYQKNKAELQRKGEYDPIREAWELERAGLNDYTLLDDNGNLRNWDRYSPTARREMFDIIAPEFQKFAPQEYLRKSSKPFYDIYGVKPENQQAAIAASIRKMQDNGDYEFFKDQARERVRAIAEANGQSLTPQQEDQLADMQLAQDIRNNATQFLQEKEVLDNSALKQYEIANSNRQNALNRASAERRASMRSSGQQSQNGPLGFVDMIRMNTRNNVQKKTGTDPTDIVNTLNEFRARYKNLGYKDTDPQIQRIDKVLNSEGKAFVDNAKEYLIKNGFLAKGESGNLEPTQKYYKYADKALRINHKDLRYNDMISEPVSDIERQVLMSMVGGKTSNTDYKGQYSINNFQSKSFKTLINRQAEVDKKPKNKIATAFERYVQKYSHVKSYSYGPSDVLSTGAIDSGRIDVNGLQYFKVSDLERFTKETGFTVAQLAQATGGHIVTRLDEDLKNAKNDSEINKKQPVSVEYVAIPSTTSVDVSGQNETFVNSLYDKLIGGASNAFKIEDDRQYESLDD